MEDEMAKWWELTIPVVGALGGVGITSGIQMVTEARKRKHEIELKHHDEKKLAYANFVIHVDELLKCNQEISEIRTRVDKYRKMLEGLNDRRIEAEHTIIDLEEEARVGNSRLGSEGLERLAELKRTLEELPLERNDIDAKFDHEEERLEALTKTLNELAVEVRKSTSVIEFLGSNAVRRCANKLSYSILIPELATDVTKAKEEFISAARKDLGV
ncbi:hypothetical protein [Actinomadura fibrosa]|uniref:Uncharacterized protein n=1 Tax=Actinomadura fibrosa TaxID=111802 RepID=A0ABW2XNW0_9ACTN|nr:hypothetical protein [Actinomadura fibrosa]